MRPKHRTIPAEPAAITAIRDVAVDDIIAGSSMCDNVADVGIEHKHRRVAGVWVNYLLREINYALRPLG